MTTFKEFVTNRAVHIKNFEVQALEAAAKHAVSLIAKKGWPITKSGSDKKTREADEKTRNQFKDYATKKCFSWAMIVHTFNWLSRYLKEPGPYGLCYGNRSYLVNIGALSNTGGWVGKKGGTHQEAEQVVCAQVEIAINNSNITPACWSKFFPPPTVAIVQTSTTVAKTSPPPPPPSPPPGKLKTKRTLCKREHISKIFPIGEGKTAITTHLNRWYNVHRNYEEENAKFIRDWLDRVGNHAHVVTVDKPAGYIGVVLYDEHGNEDEVWLVNGLPMIEGITEDKKVQKGDGNAVFWGKAVSQGLPWRKIVTTMSRSEITDKKRAGGPLMKKFNRNNERLQKKLLEVEKQIMAKAEQYATSLS